MPIRLDCMVKIDFDAIKDWQPDQIVALIEGVGAVVAVMPKKPSQAIPQLIGALEEVVADFIQPVPGLDVP
jgi:hypothetical protein